MDFIQRLTRYFVLLRKQLRRHRRTVIATACAVVFATTYALILPAITLDQQTASEQPGISLEQTADDQSPDTEAAPAEEPAAAAEEQEPAAATEAAPAAESSEPAAAAAPAASEQPAAETQQPAAEPSDTTPQYAAADLTATQGDYKVSVSYDESAQLPAGAQLRVRELSQASNEYRDAKQAVVDQKNSAGQNVSADSMGMAALDVSILDAQGNEVEPAASAKVNVRIELATLPTEDTSTDALRDSLEVQHIDAQGTVDTVATPDAHDDVDGTVQVNASADTATAQFDVDSFSTFTITWRLLGKEKAVYTVHLVDTNGNDVSAPQMQNVTIDNLSSITLADHAALDGYEFQGAHLDSVVGQDVTSVDFRGQLSTDGLLHVIYYNGDQQVAEDDVKVLTDQDDQTTRDIYFVYHKVTTSDDGAVTLSYDANAGLDDAAVSETFPTDLNHWYIEQLWAQLEHDNVEVDDFRFVDIQLSDGTEPASTVKTTVNLPTPLEVSDGDDVKVVHFKGDGQVETLDPSYDASDGSVSSVTFDADSYSIYGIAETTQDVEKTYRCTYTFQHDDGSPYEFTLNNNPATSGNQTVTGTKTSQQIVKNGGQLLNVGVPAPMYKTNENQDKPDSYGHEFLGWGVVDDNDQVDTNKDDLIKPSTDGIYLGNAISITDEKDDNVTLRAVFSDDVYVTFHDVNNTSIIRTVTVPKGHSIDLSQYTAVPASGNQSFLGWSTAQGKTSQSDALDSTHTFTEDTSLYPVIGTGYWLRFDANDNDADPTRATYTSPVFVAANGSQSRPSADPTRTGYTFAGWYEKDANGNLSNTQYSFSGSLNDNKTLYAKWTPNQVNYRVVYWEENPDDYGFSYFRSGTLTGTAGQNTDAANIDLTDADSNAVQGFHHHSSNENDRTDPAHLAHTSEDAVIKGDGTTVVNVYFDRDIYTVKFVNSANASGYWNRVTNRNDIQGQYDYDRNGYNGSGFYQTDNGGLSTQQVRGYFNDGYRVYNWIVTDSGTIDALTITAKYGASIDDQWPSRRADVTNPDTGRAYPVNWKVSPDQNDNTYQAHISTMPLNGFTFYYSAESSGYTMNVNYYVQGVGGDDTFNLDHTDSFSSNNNRWNTTKEDYYDLRGFTPIFASPQYAGGVSGVTNYVTPGNPGNTGAGRASSNHVSVGLGSDFSRVGGRNSTTYQVNFYYARNKYNIDFTPNSGVAGDTDVTETYFYQASIANAAPDSYVKGQTTRTGSKGETLTFAGWYDNPDGLGDEYVFTGKTMPVNNLHLYGKWTTNVYTVKVDPAGGKINNQDDRQDVETYSGIEHGDKFSQTNVGNDPTRDGYVFVGWYQKNADGTESLYDFDSQVTSDVTIVAHWKKIGDYKVRYVDQDQTELQIDGKVFADQAEVSALAWPNETEVPAGKQFVGWRLKDGTVVQPGQTFVLNAEDAEYVDTDKDGKPDHYSVTLTAQYTAIGTTYVQYMVNAPANEVTSSNLTNPEDISNNMQANIPLNTTTKISDGTGFARNGYVLVGWNTEPDGKGTHYELGDTYGVDGTRQDDGSFAGNVLYAEWVKPISIHKVDSKDTSKGLSGATFQLTKQDSDTYRNVTTDDFYGKTASDSVGTYTTDESGNVTIGALRPGDYKLTETKAPDGYNTTNTETAFTVNSDGSLAGSESQTGGKDATYVITIQNTPGTPLPSTGGTGTAPFAAVGASLITLALIGGIALRRRNGRGNA